MSSSESPQTTRESIRALPTGIWTLGLVSLFMDTSSELVHSLLPVFMASTLGASMMTIGLVEGIAESTAAITKVFSGAISDWIGKRKFLVVLGYGLAAFTKPLFPLATTINLVLTARFIDRIGKGIRGAPRDALIADIAPRDQLGAAYGLRQALDTIGAFLGPLLGMVFISWLAGDIRTVLWVAVFPAFIAVAFLVFGVHEPRRDKAGSEVRKPITLMEARRLPLRFWLTVLLGALFTLARFSEAFLVLRAQDIGLALVYVPLVLIVMNVVYAATAYPAGAASDRFSRKWLLIIGLAMLIAADFTLAMATKPLHVLIGTAIWGLHMGVTQGLFNKLVAETAPSEIRGTAFGIFNLVGGGSLLLASVIAGALWSRYGAPATFWAGAGFAALAVLGLLAYRRRSISGSDPAITSIIPLRTAS